MKENYCRRVGRYAAVLAYLGVATGFIAAVGIDEASAQMGRVAGMPPRGATVSAMAPFIRWHEGVIARCNQTNKGQPLIDCIGNMMAKLSGAVDFGEVPTKAPQIIAQTGEAATIRGKPKVEALAVLHRAASIIRGLATKTAADSLPAYNALSGVLGRAIAVIERGG